MKTAWTGILVTGLTLIAAMSGVCQSRDAAPSEIAPTITIYVRNYAGVEARTLAEAEEVARGIFSKAGMETRWISIPLPPEGNQNNPAVPERFTFSDFQLNIIPRTMSDLMGISNNRTGMAPGNGPNRQFAYVFYNNIEIFLEKLSSARTRGTTNPQASKSQILGCVIAHEIGHLLLNQQAHSTRGIMRGEWNPKDFEDAARGLMVFSSKEAKSLRVDLRRRKARKESVAATSVGPAAGGQ